jgi:hypothetical protein
MANHCHGRSGGARWTAEQRRHPMANSTVRHRLSSSLSIVWLVAQQIVKTIRSVPILCSIFLTYFIIFMGVLTGGIPYIDLALINVRLVCCWVSALLVGSLLYWFIRRPDSHIYAPIPMLTRDEVDYLKGGIKEVFRERLSEMSIYIDQMGTQYRIHGGDLTDSAEKALGPQSMLRAKQIKDSLQEKRLVLSQPGETLRTWCAYLLILTFLNIGLIIIIVMLLGAASGLGLPPATYKHFKINLSNLLSFSSFLLIWSYWFFWVICPEDDDNNRTRLGDAVLDFYKVHRPFRIP